MKKRWKRKGSKVIAAAAAWQAPPRYRKLDDVREALARNPADEFAEMARDMGLDVDEQSIDEWRRYGAEPVERSAAEDES